MKVFRYSVPRSIVMSVVSGLPVAPLQQHAVTAGAALEIDVLADFEFGLGHRRRLRIQRMNHLFATHRRRTANLQRALIERLLVIRFRLLGIPGRPGQLSTDAAKTNRFIDPPFLMLECPLES